MLRRPQGGDQEDVEEDDRDAVVEQRFALDEDEQPVRHAEFAKGGGYRDRVRGRDQRPEQQRGGE